MMVNIIAKKINSTIQTQLEKVVSTCLGHKPIYRAPSAGNH